MNTSTLGIAAATFVAGLIIGVNVHRFGPAANQYGITLRPRNHEKFESKWPEIHKLLDKNKHLYFIEEYRAGTKVTTFGSQCDLLPLRNLQALHQTVPRNYTGHTVQIGIGISGDEESPCLDETACPPEAPPMPNMPQGHYKQYMLDSAAMVQAVNDCINGQCPP